MISHPRHQVPERLRDFGFGCHRRVPGFLLWDERLMLALCRELVGATPRRTRGNGMTMRAGEVYEHPYERLVVRVGTAESDGRELVADLYVRADAPGVPRHIHPTVAETGTVVRGKVSAWSPDEGERILGPGGTLHVPPNTAHGWRPVGDEEVRMLVETRPGVRFEKMWHQFMGLLQDGKAGPRADADNAPEFQSAPTGPHREPLSLDFGWAPTISKIGLRLRSTVRRQHTPVVLGQY
jgi:quercetin dioxygenase-like cupin family protein